MKKTIQIPKLNLTCGGTFSVTNNDLYLYDFENRKQIIPLSSAEKLNIVLCSILTVTDKTCSLDFKTNHINDFDY